MNYRNRLLILACILPLSLFAQSEFTLGIKGGMNISTFRSKDVINDYVAAGYHVGAYARLPLAGALSVQPELQYSQKGATIKEAIGNYLSKADLSLKYVDVLGLLDLKFAGMMHVQGGLVIGILTDAGIKNKTDNPENINMEEAMQQDDLHLFDPGYALGIQADLNRINFGLRYTHGIRNISDEIEYKGESINFPELRNTIYQVYIGLRII